MSTFSIPVRVYYEDTDAGGVVYYANYLRFMERARTEWLRSLGFEQEELSTEDGVVFAVRSASLEFLKAARFNEQLRVTAEIEKRGSASITFKQRILRDEELVCSAEIRVACIDRESFSPRPIPGKIAVKIEAHKEQE